MTAPLYATREEWLVAALASQRVVFDATDHPLPERIRVTCGWPVKGGAARKRQVIGECWPPSRSADSHTEIFIAPTLDDASDVYAVLLHESIHAADGCEHGHRGPFRKLMRRVGLAGKPTATTQGEDWSERYGATIAALGSYPHAALTPQVRAAADKQSTRMLKAACGRCGYTVRMARKWAVAGMPSCVCGAGALTLADPLDIGDPTEGEE